MTAADPTYRAVVLAGGGSVRMGRAKQGLELGGRTLLQRTVDACLEHGCTRVVVVAADIAVAPYLERDARVVTTVEDPPGGGPVAGLVAGLTALGPAAADRVWVLACDLPRVGDLVAAVTASARAEAGAAEQPALVPVDAEGRPQYLAACYPAAALLAATRAAVATSDISVKRFLADVEFRAVRLPPHLFADVDDPEQARAAGIRI